jgi:NAD+--dinitrogen-reductase ADP-D-ribosyltransferase
LNLCNLPPWSLASHHYNQNPQRVYIQGTERINSLLRQLDPVDDPQQCGALFHDFMDVTFQLHQWQREASSNSRKSLKNSYLRFLRGWLFDSNSVAGAVLKGWVESRLGLLPTYHHGIIDGIHSEAYFRYLVDRMRGSARTSAILSQLDLLYEYVQYQLHRDANGTHRTLYRGINTLEDHIIIQKSSQHCLMRLNNLNSFTADFERAWEFGSRVLQAEVPLTKIFFLSGVLPKALLQGEDEYLVIGGDYDVKILIGG